MSNKPKNKVWGLIVSNKLTLVALLVFAVSMAYATFLENDFGTPYARNVVYNTWWFEGVMLILGINFFANIFRYKLYRKEKWSILTFHLAFIVMIIGAGITRYFGQEGLIRIREGQSSNVMIAQDRGLFIHTQSEEGTKVLEVPLHYVQEQNLDKTIDLGLTQRSLSIHLDRFVPDAVQGVEEGSKEDQVIELVAVAEGNRKSFFLENKGVVYINGYAFTLNNPRENAVNLNQKGEAYFIESPKDFEYMVMATQQQGRLLHTQEDTLQLRALYRSGDLSFVVKEVYEGKKLGYQSTEDKELKKEAADLLFLTISDGDQFRKIILPAVDGVMSRPQQIKVGDQSLQIAYGPRLELLPFDLYLSDFQLQRYPGSVSPSSYASELIVKDPEEGEFPVRISMNNVLDHKGYRFFQASYDLDELGTVLSVNQDYWGTRVTYVGYFLMMLGMLFSFFGKGSRFVAVSRQLKKLQYAPIIVLLVLPITLKAASPAETSLLIVDRQHAEVFGQLLVQDMDGRIKPINTLASELLRKLTRKTSYTLPASGETLNADQVFLSINQAPVLWESIEVIKIDLQKGQPIFEALNIEPKSLLAFTDLLDEQGNYRLVELVGRAQQKKPAERSEQDNELIKVDERFNILYQALSGNYLKIFPLPDDPSDTWFNAAGSTGFKQEDAVFVRNILPVYYQDIAKAQRTGDWTVANSKLTYLKTFQEVMGEKLIPDPNRLKAELLYNQLNIYNRLFPVYWLLGITLLVLAILKRFYFGKWLKWVFRLALLGVWLGFIAQTVNMGLRWYAGGYPPWSNGYEMLILVSWALLLFGFLFQRRSDFIIPVVALFTGTLLFVSYLDWLNPEITSLVPVLKSYWLKIHVAIIVSSYAPLALSALLGALCLIFMIVQDDRFRKSILELSMISELSMTIGLYMLATGTFLGGVWANESWGRYWGWDPKETWALISIMVYAIVLHMRLIPSLRSLYAFNLASVLAFSSIVMTSFGVNYYLSGLHSYAAGDPLPIPDFVWVTIGVVAMIAVGAYYREGKGKKYPYQKK
ncbi:cytochrome c biogenesis protein [Algivirga pacifica]|uniref:Cytochrome c biogenesis protein CcsA n=1 Tax=Algivirga pacifica TaxID=1162670 RepID=A0ABP9D9C3_9BACT